MLNGVHADPYRLLDPSRSVAMCRHRGAMLVRLVHHYPQIVQRELRRPHRMRGSQELLAASRGHRLEAWVATAVTLGMRPGELRALQWADVDLDAGTLNVNAALKWTPDGPELGPTKTGKVRTLAMPAELGELLRQHRRRQAVERDVHGSWPAEWAGLVFTTAAGTPYEQRNLRRDIAELGKRAGVDKLPPYSLRHTAASIMSAEGVALELVADVLGRVDTNMVMRHYRHQTAPSVTAAVATGSRLLADSQ